MNKPTLQRIDETDEKLQRLERRVTVLEHGPDTDWWEKRANWLEKQYTKHKTELELFDYANKKLQNRVKELEKHIGELVLQDEERKARVKELETFGTSRHHDELHKQVKELKHDKWMEEGINEKLRRRVKELEVQRDNIRQSRDIWASKVEELEPRSWAVLERENKSLRTINTELGNRIKQLREQLHPHPG